MVEIEAAPVETLPDDSSSAASEAVSATDIAAETSPAALAAIDWSPAAAPEAVPLVSAEPAPAAAVETAPVASVEAVSAAPRETVSPASAPVSYQTLANAYGDLTRRSLDQTTSFFEKFWGVRSLDKVFELQTEFAKQAYDNFVIESQRIRDLHCELARQRLERWEGFVGMTKAR
ncbi:MAG: phasin family protein [Bradyrhizobium sp.]|nr:phasin family protein [Bradyrhizobium sp.]